LNVISLHMIHSLSKIN